MAYIRDSAGGVILRGMERRASPRPDARGARRRARTGGGGPGGARRAGGGRREPPGPGARGARHRWLLAVLAVVLLFTFGLAGSGGAATAYDDEELKFVGLINDYREQNGLRPGILSEPLAAPADAP